MYLVELGKCSFVALDHIIWWGPNASILFEPSLFCRCLLKWGHCGTNFSCWLFHSIIKTINLVAVANQTLVISAFPKWVQKCYNNLDQFPQGKGSCSSKSTLIQGAVLSLASLQFYMIDIRMTDFHCQSNLSISLTLWQWLQTICLFFPQHSLREATDRHISTCSQLILRCTFISISQIQDA